MKKVYWSILTGLVISLVSIVTCRPGWISDDNRFLEGFVNHEFLSVLGVILTITLASIAQIHLSLNQIEERWGFRLPATSRKEIKQSAHFLIGLFVVGLLAVIVKPMGGDSQTWTAFVNAIAITVLAVYVLILLDITRSVFVITSTVSDDGEE